MRTTVPLFILISLGCQSGAKKPPKQAAVQEPAPKVPSPDERADLVEAAIRKTGETTEISGAATPTFPGTFHLIEPRGDGSTPIFQKVDLVHTVAGQPGRDLSGLVLCRVGLVANEVCIVLRGKPYSDRYEVVWESWGENRRRAGSPPDRWIEFKE
jgi:hypothetical protein